MSISSAHPSPAIAPIGAQIPSREELRRQLRAQRRALTLAQQQQAAAYIARAISRTHFMRAGAHVGVYLSQGREADLSVAIRRAHAIGCHVYVPCVTHMRRRQMAFVKLLPGATLKKNVYGILEPVTPHCARISVHQLDVILLPLVGIDARGWRLGSGAGFYDRHLSHLRGPRLWRRPKLIGIAYEFQRVPHLEPSRWDVPVEGLITERGYHALRPWQMG
jgi:5-formyltetrahydrofolate cyclo-ligase